MVDVKPEEAKAPEPKKEEVKVEEAAPQPHRVSANTNAKAVRAGFMAMSLGNVES